MKLIPQHNFLPSGFISQQTLCHNLGGFVKRQIIPNAVTYCCVHDARTVGADRVRYMPDVDSVEVFVVTGSLDEDLVVEVVEKLGHENVNIPHDLQHIQTLESGKNYIQILTMRMLPHLPGVILIHMS